MLVDALNSHPDIDCTHSDQGHHGKGHLKGHAQCVVEGNKAIVLTRNHVDRMLSFQTTLAEQIKDNHIKQPIKVKRTRLEKAENRYKNQKIKGELFKERAKKLPNTLFIPYEELTQNKDIREIPHDWALKICNFLEIPYHPLKTRFYKPEVWT